MDRKGTEPKTSRCSSCARKLSAHVSVGVCPACLLKQGLITETGAGDGPEENGLEKAVRPVPDIQEIRRSLPQFEILEFLGRGGMGVVYKARQKSLDRLVALKILAPERERDPEFAERFAHEARILAQLNHPNIVTVHDFGESHGMFFFAMEFVDGVNLRHLISDRRLAPEEAMAIVPAICEALQYAHDRDVVHRDIKPENLLLDRSGRIKIADFGIAKLMDRIPGTAETTNEERHVAGTPKYMAPEQQSGTATVDHRADIYSLGVVFYEMLTGELPKENLRAPSTRSGPRIDVRLDDVVLRTLEEAPERRYQQASEIQTAIEALSGGTDLPKESLQRKSRLRSKRFAAVAALLVVAAVAAVSAIVTIQQQPEHHSAAEPAATAAPEEDAPPPEKPATDEPGGTASHEIEFVRIPAGTFLMGSPEDEPGRLPHEGSQHAVTISRDFYMAQTPVTWDQWIHVRQWATANGYTALPLAQKGSHGDERHDGNEPVTMVSWWDAIQWLNAKSEMEGRRPVYYTAPDFAEESIFRTETGRPPYPDWSADGYRLPTEAEWEYACRAETVTAFYTGDINYTEREPLDPNLDRAGWYAGNSDGRTHPVAQKEPNAWGLYDMHGSVWEWCWDFAARHSAGEKIDPTGPAAGPSRIRRGGSWEHDAFLARSAFRLFSNPMHRLHYVGLRPARTIEPPDATESSEEVLDAGADAEVAPEAEPKDAKDVDHFARFREWTDRDGRAVVARVLAKEEKRVRLLRRDGRTFWVDTDSLAEKDRERARSFPEFSGAEERSVDVWTPVALEIDGTAQRHPGSPLPREVLFVQLHGKPFDQEVFMTTVIQGLANRKLGTPAVFALLHHVDPRWVRTLQQRYPHTGWRLVEPVELFRWAKDKGIIEGQVLYNPAEKDSINTVMMLCAVHGAIPTATRKTELPVVVDARGKWEHQVEAVRWVEQNLLSRMNRSLFAVHESESPFLKDLLVSEKVVTMFGYLHRPGPRRELFLDLIEGGDFLRGTAVLGYHSWETEVVNELTTTRTQFGVWSDYAANLSFYRQFPAITRLEQPPKATVRYDPEKTYAALVVSDGDNIQLNLNSIRLRFEERGNSDIPMSWTVSNWLRELGPPVLEWFYEQARFRGNDSFLMGPSGYGFLHPSINPDNEWFARETRQAARVLDMESYVHWDRYSDRQAMARSIQAYRGGPIRGVFSPIHPPVPDWIGDVRTFPEWYRFGIGETSIEGLAERLNDENRRGRLGYVYIIHTVPINEIERLPGLLDPHVELVGHRELIDLAWQKRRGR